MPAPVRAIVAIAALCALLGSPAVLLAQSEGKPPAPPERQDPEKPAPKEKDPAEPDPAKGGEGEPATGAEPEAGKTTAAPDPAIATVREFIAKQSAGDAPKIDKSKTSWRTMLPKFPTLAYTAGKKYFWDLTTNQGAIRIRFYPDIAPEHVANFIYLTELGYFDGLNFHRVITGFMAQGGCPLGTGGGGPGYYIAGEFPKENGELKVKHDRPGLLSMANRPRVVSDGSQFFITFRPTPHLDGLHTVFGEVTAGMDTVQKLEQLGSPGGAPREKLVIEKATIVVE